MSKAYPQELRDRVIRARDSGLRTRRVAELFGVDESWVRRVMQRRRETGETRPRPRGGATVVKIDMNRLRELVDAQPDATVKELHERLDTVCSVSAVDMALRRMGLTFKKRRFTQRSRIGPTSPSGGSGGRAINRDRKRVD